MPVEVVLAGPLVELGEQTLADGMCVGGLPNEAHSSTAGVSGASATAMRSISPSQ